MIWLTEPAASRAGIKMGVRALTVWKRFAVPFDFAVAVAVAVECCCCCLRMRVHMFDFFPCV